MSYTVQSLHFYPLKSAQAVNVEQADVTDRGLAHDRLWMLVDETLKFVSQRENPMLATVSVTRRDNGDLIFDAPGVPTLAVDGLGYGSIREPVRIWNDDCAAQAGMEKASVWFSDYLQQSVRMVRIADDYNRQVDLNYGRPGDRVGFADGFPLLVTCQASLDGLSPFFQIAAMNKTIQPGMDRFRPNIVLAGGEAFAEDTIHRLRIGDVELELVKHCSRCPIPGIDQKTGSKSPDGLLKTLGFMRTALQNGKPGMFFGENAIARQLGTIKVGDKAEIVATRPLNLASLPRRKFYSAGMKPL